MGDIVDTEGLGKKHIYAKDTKPRGKYVHTPPQVSFAPQASAGDNDKKQRRRHEEVRRFAINKERENAKKKAKLELGSFHFLGSIRDGKGTTVRDNVEECIQLLLDSVRTLDAIKSSDEYLDQAKEDIGNYLVERCIKYLSVDARRTKRMPRPADSIIEIDPYDWTAEDEKAYQNEKQVLSEVDGRQFPSLKENLLDLMSKNEKIMDNVKKTTKKKSAKKSVKKKTTKKAVAKKTAKKKGSKNGRAKTK